MAFTLFRTAHSTFVKETEDFTTGLTTPEGRPSPPRPTSAPPGSSASTTAGAIRLIDDYRPGDICITNDPYSGFVCTHSPDMHIWKPVFREGEIVAFSVGHIHNTDVGGAVPASLSRTLTEVHQEGIRIPPAKLISEGKLNRALLDVILHQRARARAELGRPQGADRRLNTGERKVHEMIARFGVETFREGVADLLDYAEAQARAIVRDLPDGDYLFADYIDEDAVGRLALPAEADAARSAATS